jgi:hypothetical protein
MTLGCGRPSSESKRLNGPEEAVHTRAGIVVRKYCAILPMALVEFCSATRRTVGERHVPPSVESLAAGPVEPAAKSARVLVVQPCSLILKVQDQPDFEAGVGDCEFDAALAGLFDGIFQIRVISRPLNIEDTPKLIDLALLINSSSAGGDSH